MDLSARLSEFPRERLAVLPTPIQRLDRLSKYLQAQIWTVRDDLTGVGLGGNKVRKLEYLLADARKSGHDVILTTGANQSNHCRLTAACCARLGLPVHLVLGGRKPRRRSGNLLLDHLLGAEVHHAGSEDWTVWARKMEALAADLRADGAKPYLIPVGGSVPIGSLGYVSAAIEFRAGLARMGVEPQSLYLATSSGGTHAGLVTGARVIGWEMPIVGIGVARDSATLLTEVRALAHQTASLLGLPAPDLDETVQVDASYIGAGYAASTDGEREAVDLLARLEGILLDHVYTGKAMAGLIDHIRTGRVRRDRPVLFLHTGGNVQLFK